MTAAFIAGCDFGRAFPELVEAVLPDGELSASLRRLSIIVGQLRAPQFSPDAISVACEAIVRSQWSSYPREQHSAVLAEALLKSIRAGFAATTAAQTDPVLADFLGTIPTHIYLQFPRDLCLQAILHSPVCAVEKTLAEQVAHPLLRLAQLNNRASPLEGEAMRAFLADRLAALGVTEDECPAADVDLVDWTARALNYGHHLQSEQPEAVAAILAETGEDKVQKVRKLVADVLVDAGGTLDPQRLVPAVLATVFVGTRSDWYGPRLARVLYVADFAVWVPWIQGCAPSQPPSAWREAT